MAVKYIPLLCGAERGIALSNELVNCYYCWHTDILARFKVPVKSGYSERCKCPECKLYLNYAILTKFTTEDKAKWLYLNIRKYRGKHFNFYDNIQFDKIKFRLYGYERTAFWDAWKWIKLNYVEKGSSELDRLYKIIKSSTINQQTLNNYSASIIDGEQPE